MPTKQRLYIFLRLLGGGGGGNFVIYNRFIAKSTYYK